MIFSSAEFFIFLFIVVSSVAILKGQKNKKILLLLASYFFYGYWDWRFIFLIAFSTIVDYLIGWRVYNSEEKIKRKKWLIASMIVNLGLLGFFKYYNFFVDGASVILSSWGLSVANLDIILPVGISFYTFQTMSYTIDIYRKKLEPSKDFVDYALYVAFFPQIVAGPIVRAIDFLPQLSRKISVTKKQIWIGSQIFLVGLFKKLLIADNVAPFVDEVFGDPNYYSTMTIWLAVVAYSLQIYCDFSGYSDMAIGCAKMLGFDLKRNFYMPYLSKNITDFWRRWHISLSSWLKDYLYISLGGNRNGTFNTYRNLTLTMLLGGLWHGASWNFVIWGGAHGVALALHKFIGEFTKCLSNNSIYQVFCIGITYIFVSLIWVLFRAQSSGHAISMYKGLFGLNGHGVDWLYLPVFVAMFFAVLGHAWGNFTNIKTLAIFETPNSYRAAFGISLLLVLIFMMAPLNFSPFIYFQF